LIHRYYGDTFSRDFSELVRQADKIDSADLTEEEVLHPENHPYILLSMTLSGRHPDDEPYWNQIVRLLQTSSVDQIMKDPEVAARCEEVIEDNRTYRDLLKTHTTVHGQVAVTDFRGLEKDPSGNRFLVYSLYPESAVQVKIRFDGSDPNRVIVSVGHSIFNRNCRVNVGLLMKRFEGGGHPGAGSCRFHVSKSDAYISAILSTLIQNDPIEA
jgi:nanoRNase/pAp phosphatase (c-di-AMP/oligoRNAs hydrolase)